jgi:magnesium chelatase subunit I
MHYGLLPRANRGVFAVNELPDLAGKVQVGLFNILQEGDVQIKGYPVRLPLDVLMVFSANPEDYTARGKIITPLKDRIGSEIRTHYPATRQHAMEITAQEAWVGARGCDVNIPAFVREVVEEVAFQARQDPKIDKRSGVSQRLPISLLENVVSSAERRALQAHEPMIVPRITDIYAALPAITGKFELEYEGELRGGDNVARDIIRAAVGNVFSGYYAGVDLKQVTEWFDLGGNLQIDDTLPAAQLLERAAPVQGLREVALQAGIGERAAAPLVASAIDFVLEGLYAQKKISRSDEFQYQGVEPQRRPSRPGQDAMLERDIQIPGSKKKYYN